VKNAGTQSSLEDLLEWCARRDRGVLDAVHEARRGHHAGVSSYPPHEPALEAYGVLAMTQFDACLDGERRTAGARLSAL
jgi:hypothetical protein